MPKEILAVAISTMAQQLKNQINDLQKLENFRKDFIANVSHEIKTPLTAILSAVEYLENTFQHYNEQEKKCLKIISDQGTRLNALVNDILSLAILESRLSMSSRNFEKFNLTNTISNAVNAFENLHSDNLPQINYTQDKEITFSGDEHLIEQALNNLISNAIKYSQSKSIDIKAQQESNNIKIIVQDYGIGIPKEDVPRIFERFYRIDKARSRALGGTGLGLAIVKNIITLHNGTINLETAPNHGCKFAITLPVNG